MAFDSRPLPSLELAAGDTHSFIADTRCVQRILTEAHLHTKVPARLAEWQLYASTVAFRLDLAHLHSAYATVLPKNVLCPN